MVRKKYDEDHPVMVHWDRAVFEALSVDWKYIVADPNGHANIIAEHLRGTEDAVACLVADWIDGSNNFRNDSNKWKIEFVQRGGRGKRTSATLNKMRQSKLASIVREREQAVNPENRTHGWRTRVIRKAAKDAGVSVSTIERAIREQKQLRAKWRLP